MRNRELVATRRENGVVVAGRCSLCDRPFEPILVTIAEARSEVVNEFEQHVCDADSNPASDRQRDC